VSYTLSYSRWVKPARIAVLLLLAVAALVQWVLAWVHFIQPLTQGVSLVALALRPLIAANLGLLLTVGSLAFVYLILPDLALADEGLAVRTLFGWRVMPWAAVTTVRTIPFAQSSRKMVLVQGGGGRGISWLHLVSACLGAGFKPGILFTSAIRDFEPLVDRLRQEVALAAPRRCSTTSSFPCRPTGLRAGAHHRRTGQPVTRRRLGAVHSGPTRRAMAAVTAGLLLVLLLLLALRGGAWWKPVLLIGLGAIEWAAGALYFYALGALLPGEVELRQGARLYPFPQIPRALLALPMAMLVGGRAALPGDYGRAGGDRVGRHPDGTAVAAGLSVPSILRPWPGPPSSLLLSLSC